MRLWPLRARRFRGPALVASLSARRAVRSGVIWGAAFGVMTGASALSYDKIYATAALREALARAFGANVMTTAIFGPAPALQTVAGFTSFKVSLTLSILGALWGLSTTTAALRGEEDTHRADLLLAGPRDRVAATAQSLAGVAAGLVALGVAVAVVTLAIDATGPPSLTTAQVVGLAAGVVASAGVFAALGTWTSQVAGTRHDAMALGGEILAAAYALRLVADAGMGLHALVWATPLGWVEEIAPLTSPHPLAALPVVVAAGALTGLSLRAVAHRDVGAGLWARDDAPRRARRPLTGPGALSRRLTRATILRWWIGVAIGGGLIGLVAHTAGQTIGGSSVQEIFSRLGASAAGERAVLGIASLLLAVVVSLLGVGQVAAARSEEAFGHLDWLLASPIARTRWLVERLAIAVVAVVGASVLEGLVTWVTATSQGARVGLPTLLEAGANLVPPALTLTGLAALAFGVAPRATASVGYGLIVWSLLVEIVGGIGALTRWLFDTSVFHFMAAAPAESPHLLASAVMTAIGLTSGALGVAAFARRDVHGA